MDPEHPVFRTLGTIEERLREKLTVESLAESVHFSRYHYQRLFREAVGESVMRYVTRRRLSLAAAELAGSGRSVLEIALRYGYDSHEGFTRSFRTYMGVTPAEYRKHHASIASPQMEKERNAMLYSKPTDEIIRELNALIVRARETAAWTEKNTEISPETAALSAPLRTFLAARTDALAADLTVVLDRVTALPRQPDGISARFALIKAIEDAVFQSNITAFQARLTFFRALPAYRAALETLCGKYEALARAAQIGSGRIAAFFRELASLIFRDMRKNAQGLLDRASEQGRRAAETIPSAHAYIGDEVRYMTDELTGVPLEEVTASFLENLVFRLGVILSAAELDALHSPSDGSVFEGISGFRDRLREAEEFFQSLSEGAVRNTEEETGRSLVKQYRDMAFQGNILLFYLRGEVQRLDPCLNAEQRAAFGIICERVNAAVGAAQRAEEEADRQEIMKILRSAYRALTAEADKLGACGDAVKFIGKNLLMGEGEGERIMVGPVPSFGTESAAPV